MSAAKAYRHLDTVTAFFVAVLLISNVASTKIVTLGSLTFDGGTLIFPLSYIFGDILTEVYGYAASRKVIWLGFINAAVMAAVFAWVGSLPAAGDWPHQTAYEQILGSTPRIVLASLLAYWLGNFVNAFILAKLKIVTQGKHLWMRTMGSTLVGQGVDTAVFAGVAFWGVLPSDIFVALVLSNYIFKCGVEAVFTPVTYGLTHWLKRQEQEDAYDTTTNFNPFLLAPTPLATQPGDPHSMG